MIRFLKTAEVTVGSFCLFAMFAILCVNILMRYGFNAALPWAEEVSNYLFVWAGFLSCAYLLGEDEHIRVDFVVGRLSQKSQAAIRLFNDFVLVVFFVSMVVPSFQLLGKLRSTPSLRIPEAIPYSILPITMLVCLVHLLSLIRRHYAAYRGDGT